MSQENYTWQCPKCGNIASGNFCSNCAQERPADGAKICKCGCKNQNTALYCVQCGKRLDGRNNTKRIIAIVGAIVLAVLALMMLKPHEHKWQAATCTEAETCKSCGETKGSPAGHKWDAATCTSPKTCSVCGETSGTAANHKWSEASCTSTQTCSVCGESSGSAPGHQWEAATCTSPKTCSVCGETEGSAAGHDWKAATYDAPKTCRVCGKTEGNKKGYTAKLSGSSQKVTLYKGNSTLNVHALVLNQKVTKCRQLTVNMDVEMKGGTNCSDWELWGRVNGTFTNIGSIYLPGGNGYTSQTVYFSSPVSFDALVVIPSIPGGYSWALGFTVTDVYAD